MFHSNGEKEMLKISVCLEKVKALKNVLVNEKGKVSASPWGFLMLGRFSFRERRGLSLHSNRKMGEC
jgi:hypothetical protein